MKNADDNFKPLSPPVIAFLRYTALGISKVLWRIRFTDTGNIPKEDGKGLIIAANHQTYIDPFWICLPVYRRLRFMAWDEVFDWPLVGRAISRLGAFPVSLKQAGSTGSLKASLALLRKGSTLVVFPEGSRGKRDGTMLRFKPGAAHIALEAGVDILPVTIRGGNRAWPAGRYIPFPAKIEIVYHPVLRTCGEEDVGTERERIERLTACIQRVIESGFRRA